MFQGIRFDQQKEVSSESETQRVNNCQDPNATIKEAFVDKPLEDRIAKGQYPVLRPVFLKPHGMAKGMFTINPNLRDDLKVGVFKHESFPAWVRFSSDTDKPSNPDLKTSLGIGMKLFNVPGEKLLECGKNDTTHDFLLQNHDVFVVDTARDLCELVSDALQYLIDHPKTKQIIDDMQKDVRSVLETPYWSALPYAFGHDPDRYVKYKLEPAYDSGIAPHSDMLIEDPNYLRRDLRSRLLKSEFAFKFYLQFYIDPDTTPLDRATVRWDETVSIPEFVATLTLHRQDIDERGQPAYGENLAYNPWRALREHSPEGTLAEARKVAYQASARLRRDLNGIPNGEPDEPRSVIEP